MDRLLSLVDNEVCEENFKKSCRYIAEFLNRSIPKAFQEDYKGAVVLPLPVIVVELHKKKLLPVVDKSDAKVNVAPKFSPEWQRILREKRPQAIRRRALAPNMITRGEASRNSSYSDEPLHGDQRSTFELVALPFSAAENITDQFRLPISVSIVDTWLDRSHCEFATSIPSDGPTDAPFASQLAESCGQINAKPNKILDHATHVAGVIAAQPNMKGGVGLNPFARMGHVYIDLDALRTPEYRKDLVKRLMDAAISNDVRVFNLSFEYKNDEGGADVIAKFITETISARSLFVIAAGNGFQQFSGVCAVLPACLTEAPNVLTVVGLDASKEKPTVWTAGTNQGSNTSEKFHIAAPASGIMSTTSGNYYGRMSGTSQAAPQIAAAAAYLYSVYEHLYRADIKHFEPIRVKNRLMYTADIFPSLLHKVWSGRLNMERALDYASDRMEYLDQGGVHRSVKGVLGAFGAEILICDVDGQDVTVPRKRLMRMKYDDMRKRYVLFYNEQPGGQSSLLLRIPNCKLKTVSNVATFDTDAGETVHVPFNRIRDFTASMF